MRVEPDIYEAFAKKMKISRAVAKPRILAMGYGPGPDPTDDGWELIVLRIHPDSFYRRTIKYARDKRIRETVNILRTERKFCKKVGSL